MWLCLALVPLVALGFRRGWVYVFVAGLVFHAPSARALDWSDLWLTGDQQGFRALQTDRPEEASALFTDPEWLAAAHYRARQYEASAAALAGIDTAEANYNRGNALARAGRLAEAIAAYDRALELEPGLSDAEFNRELVEELLEQQPPDSQSRPDQPDDSGEAGDAGSETEERQGQDSSEGASGEGDEEQEQQATDQREGNADSSAESPDSESERGEPREPEAGSQPETQSAQVSPEDVEDWASEQAAEQWLRRIPQDPGGLLRRKFLYQYQQLGLDQDGNRIFPGNEAEPW